MVKRGRRRFLSTSKNGIRFEMGNISIKSLESLPSNVPKVVVGGLVHEDGTLRFLRLRCQKTWQETRLVKNGQAQVQCMKINHLILAQQLRRQLVAEERNPK